MDNPNLIRLHYQKEKKNGGLWAYIVLLAAGVILGMLISFPARAEEIRIIRPGTVEVGVAPAEHESEVKLVNPYTEIMQNLTTEEVELLAKICWAEANNQGLDGMRCVYEVIFNRILSSSYPNTVTEVLSQKGQFATWKYRNNVKPTHEQYDALQIVSEEQPLLPSLKYVYFDTKGRNGRNKIKIGGHYFGAEK